MGGGRPLLPEILGQPTLERNRRFSAVTPSEKSSINTNRKFTTRFRMSLRFGVTLRLNPPKGVPKTQNGRFPCKIALRLKKVWYKVCVKTVSGKGVRHSLA